MSAGKGKPMYVEEVDETTGKVHPQSRQSASTKQKPKVRDSRKSRKPHSDSAYPAEGSSRDAPPADERERKEVRVERRKSTSSGSSKSPHKTRPPSAHENKNFPKSSIPSSKREAMDPSNYGYAPATAAAPTVSQPVAHRPRALTTQSYPRPVSYHAPPPAGGYNSRPPLSMSAYYQQPPMITPSYPPPSPSYMDNLRYNPAPQNEYIQQPQARPLRSRFESGYTNVDPISRTPSAFEPVARPPSAFEPIARTSSAFGTRSAYEGPAYERPTYERPAYEPGSYFEDTYASASEGATIRKFDRRDSIRIPSNSLSKAQADYAAMPPPMVRPSILRRSTEYGRGSDYTLDPETYRDGRTEYRREGSRPRRSSSNRHSVSYDLPRGDESVRVESANSGRRRSGFYEPTSSTHVPAYEDKLHRAATYQEDVGGSTVPLTAETLKRQQRRHDGSSRSTKSSQSRDESDYKKSATTRTTRSLSNDNENDENVTIKVTGQARVMVGGAQIHCDEGGEIEIKRQKNLPDDSERANSEYAGGGGGGGGGGGRLEDRRTRVDDRRTRVEDRRSRVERPTVGRSNRSTHSSHSYTRSTPHYPGETYF